jgi:hypothetical protein
VDVGRKLAERIESTGTVITANWQTRVGLHLSRRFPTLVGKGTERFVEPGGAATRRDEREKGDEG